MQDLKSARTMWLKGALFLIIGVVSAALLFLENQDVRTAVLIALMIWGFCRAYYFAFYVIQHYIDPGYRFSGLISFVAYTLRRRGGR